MAFSHIPTKPMTPTALPARILAYPSFRLHLRLANSLQSAERILFAL
jgi:hypothetical protein